MPLSFVPELWFSFFWLLDYQYVLTAAFSWMLQLFQETLALLMTPTTLPSHAYFLFAETGTIIITY